MSVAALDVESWRRAKADCDGSVADDTAAAAQRARIVLMAAEGVPNAEVARRIGVSRPTVVGWRSRYQERGIAGLADETGRAGRRGSSLGVTHWSSRLLARELGVRHGIKGRGRPLGWEIFL